MQNLVSDQKLFAETCWLVNVALQDSRGVFFLVTGWLQTSNLVLGKLAWCGKKPPLKVRNDFKCISRIFCYFTQFWFWSVISHKSVFLFINFYAVRKITNMKCRKGWMGWTCFFLQLFWSFFGEGEMGWTRFFLQLLSYIFLVRGGWMGWTSFFLQMLSSLFLVRGDGWVEGVKCQVWSQRAVDWFFDWVFLQMSSDCFIPNRKNVAN